MNIIKSFKKVKLVLLPSFLLFTSLSSCSGFSDLFSNSNNNNDNNAEIATQSEPSNGQCLVRWYLTNSRGNSEKLRYDMQRLNQGDIAIPKETKPVVHPTSPNRYEFIGWNTTPQNPSKGQFEVLEEIKVGNSSSMDIFAVYKIKYDVVFKDDIGTTIISKLEGLNNGDKPIYNGDTPTKERTPDKAYTYSYSFVGWSTQMQGGQDDTNTYSSDSLPVVDSSKAINNEITYYARFKESKTNIKYNLAFYDYNGKSLYSTKVNYEEKITYSKTPTRANDEDSDKTIKYTFAGWSTIQDSDPSTAKKYNDLPLVTEDTNYYAIYSITTTYIYEANYINKNVAKKIIPIGYEINLKNSSCTLLTSAAKKIKDLVISVSDTSIATINGTKLKGIKEGSFTLTVYSKSKVNQRQEKPTSITLSVAEAALTYNSQLGIKNSHLFKKRNNVWYCYKENGRGLNYWDYDNRTITIDELFGLTNSNITINFADTMSLGLYDNFTISNCVNFKTPEATTNNVVHKYVVPNHEASNNSDGFVSGYWNFNTSKTYKLTFKMLDQKSYNKLN